ncbi:ABC transporter permease [Hujiaoplasma nucleasis]|uniref:ABC transporter permease n=1 Tax=Hujiaoplasma nucleasis TaxID=2725268 RepID=A0A7L6N347_9MOLU|nr:ABC transporter permease [Hujiaoplasma nucleasis]QLY39485.1 ABC transporter permease [Hujiaoplasma nucleasis]
MVWYIIKRIILVILALFVIMTTVFILTRVSMLQIWSLPHPVSEDFKIAWNDYKIYLDNIVSRWDWGEDKYYTPIWDLVLEKAKVSLKYNVIAFVFYFFGGVSLGVVAAYYKNKTADYLISLFSMLFNSIPGFVLIFFLILLFGYHLKWFPPQEPFQNASLYRKFLGFFIPVLALSLGPMGKIAQTVRGEILDSMQSPQYLLLRAKGLTKKQAFIRHGIKDSMVVMLPEIVPLFVYVINMSFVIEYTYNINGLANLFFNALISFGGANNSIYVNTQIAVPVAVLLVGVIMIFSLISDVTLAFVDPRIAIRSKKSKKI